MNALVISNISGEYTIYDTNSKKEILAKARGVFRNNKTTVKVGDIVEYTEGSPHAIITKVGKRKNDFVRPAVANIDQAFVVTSLKEPDINTNLLDRIITIFEYQNIVPILIFSKSDLLTEKELTESLEIVNYYKGIGYNTIVTSNANPLTIEDIKPFIKGKISVFAGQSGVGKSSILNVLDDTINMDTGEISKALNRGKHTTRFTKLFNICEGWLADSPGFGTMELIDMEKIDVAHSFIEFFNLSNECKYNGCLHLNEPSCRIKKAVEQKEILQSRYENYQQFIKELDTKRKW